MKPAVYGALAAGMALWLAPATASALTMQECSAKYAAAKKSDSLGGKTWNDFRKAECGMDAAATPAAATTAEARPAAKPKAATPASAAPMGDARFPAAVDAKYAKETAGKARMHSCLDQYNTNKASNANGGMKWIQKGGGYYSECTKRLKGSA